MQTLKYGATGPDVGKLHQSLIELGYTIDASELTLSKFSGTTALAVRQFQASRNLLGDAIVGPQTWAALQAPTPEGKYKNPGYRFDATKIDPKMLPVVQAADSQIGTHEIGSSNIIEGDPYHNDGQPWCAYFVSWCYGKMVGGSPFGVIASAYKMFEWAKTHGKIVGPADSPRPGDIFVILRGDFHGHVGLCVNVLPNGMLCCVEGNAGNAVRGTLRARGGVTCLVRPLS